MKKQPKKPKHGFDGTRLERHVVVDDPNPSRKGYRERVVKNVRHDYLETLLSRRKIGESQKRTGDHIRALVETLGMSSVQAMDLAKIRVDTSGPGSEIRDAVLVAGQELNDLRSYMDQDKYALIVRICGYDERLPMVAISFEENEKQRINGACSKRTRDYCAWLFRSGLMQAAIFFGYASDREMTRFQKPRRVFQTNTSPC